MLVVQPSYNSCYRTYVFNEAVFCLLTDQKPLHTGVHTGCHYLASLSVRLSVRVSVSVCVPVFVSVCVSVCVSPCVFACLLPGFGHVDECRPLPRKVQAACAGDGLTDEDADGPLEPWQMFASRQHVRGVSVVILTLREDVTRLSYPPFIRARGWGSWVRYLRQLTAAQLHQRLFDADAETRAVFGLWALRVDSALRREDSIGSIGN